MVIREHKSYFKSVVLLSVASLYSVLAATSTLVVGQESTVYSPTAMSHDNDTLVS